MNRKKLWDNGTPNFEPSFDQNEPSLLPFIAEAKTDDNGNPIKTGCVIVCPGGAYYGHASYEGDPVSEYIRDHGISAFTLEYRYYPYDYVAIHADINRAVRWVRYHADEYNIDPDKIAVMGFSAGGHLACAGATVFDYGVETGDEIDKLSCRPDAAILCYPVVSMKRAVTHEDTRFVFIGRYEEEFKEGTLVPRFSGEEAVKEDTPPMFIWHTAADSAVKVENSLFLATSLAKYKIPFELHVFPEGEHGLNLALDFDGGAKAWAPLMIDWLKRMDY